MSLKWRAMSARPDTAVLIDVRNGYEWDVGHFQGAVRPVQESFRETVDTNTQEGSGQGLTLVHYSAQLEPFLTQGHTLNTPNTPYPPLNTPETTPNYTPCYTEGA